MADSNLYLIQITEGTRVVAEAPLIVYDKDAALRNFYEGYPQIVAQVQGVIMGLMQAACATPSPAQNVVGLAIQGNHSGLVIPQAELPPMSILDGRNGRH